MLFICPFIRIENCKVVVDYSGVEDTLPQIGLETVTLAPLLKLLESQQRTLESQQRTIESKQRTIESLWTKMESKDRTIESQQRQLESLQTTVHLLMSDVRSQVVVQPGDNLTVAEVTLAAGEGPNEEENGEPEALDVPPPHDIPEPTLQEATEATVEIKGKCV